MNRDIRLARTMVDVSWIEVLVRNIIDGYVPRMSPPPESGLRCSSLYLPHLQDSCAGAFLKAPLNVQL
jgi:hypothetical protein